MLFPEVFKRYFPPRMPCCFVRIHKTGNNAVKMSQEYNCTVWTFFTDLNLLEYVFNVIQNWETVVHNSRALKSPWKLKNCEIFLKSRWIFHRSPWMCWKAPWIKIAFVKNKMFCAKEWLKAQQYTIFLGDHESVFLWFWCSWHSSFSVFLMYPRNYALMEEGIAISDPPPP